MKLIIRNDAVASQVAAELRVQLAGLTMRLVPLADCNCVLLEFDERHLDAATAILDKKRIALDQQLRAVVDALESIANEYVAAAYLGEQSHD